MFYFDGAMNQAGRGIGAVLVSPDDVRIPVSSSSSSAVTMPLNMRLA
jgi:hypothetical protein